MGEIALEAMFSVLLVFVAVFLALWLPGTALLLRFSKLKTAEALMLGFGVSAAIYCFLMLAEFLTIISAELNTAVLVVSVFLPAWWLWKNREKIFGSIDIDARKALALFVLFCFFVLSIHATMNTFAGGSWYGDWFSYFARTQVYLTHENPYPAMAGPIYFRPPMMNLNESFFMSVFGNSFWVFQIVSVALNCAFLLPLYFVARRLLGQKSALLACVMMFFSVWILREFVFTWPKMLTAYFVLCALHYYINMRQKLAKGENIEKKDLAIFSVFTGLAYLGHVFALFFVGAVVIDALIIRFSKSFQKKFSAKQALCFAAIFLLLVGPWYAWIFSNNSLDEVFFTTSNLSLDPEQSTLQWKILTRAQNALTTTVPAPLILYYTIGYQGSTFYADSARFEKTYAQIVEFYYNNTTAAFGIGGLLAGLFVLCRKRKPVKKALAKTSPHFFILLFFLASFAGNMSAGEGATMHGYAPNIMPPVIAVLIAYIARAVFEIPKIWRKIFVAVAVLEMAVFFWLQNIIVLAGIGWPRDENRLLKMVHNLTFVKDLLGFDYLLFFALAIAIQLLALVLFIKWVDWKAERAANSAFSN